MSAREEFPATIHRDWQVNDACPEMLIEWLDWFAACDEIDRLRAANDDLRNGADAWRTALPGMAAAIDAERAVRRKLARALRSTRFPHKPDCTCGHCEALAASAALDEAQQP